MPKAASALPEEIRRFSQLASRWWDEKGPMAPLHMMQEVRRTYVDQQAERHFGHGPEGLRVLDLGCGGGLMSEALARRGARVTGVDASADVIKAARDHGKDIKNLDYICAPVEEFATSGPRKRFDLVLMLEVIEHVNDPASAVKKAAKLLDKNGLMVFSTLNRTAKGFLLGIVAAEYLLRWLPPGTHGFSRFVKPSELAGMAHAAGLEVRDIRGAVFNPFTRRFSLDKNRLDVNYFLSAKFQHSSFL